jgi:hypothetical protein
LYELININTIYLEEINKEKKKKREKESQGGGQGIPWLARSSGQGRGALHALAR